MDPLLGSALGQHCVEQRGAVELCVPIAGTALGHVQPCPCCAQPGASGTGIPPPLGARGSQPPLTTAAWRKPYAQAQSQQPG